MGLEPTTFEIEVQHASPLRHGGYLLLAEELLVYEKYYVTVIISLKLCCRYSKECRKILVRCAWPVFNFTSEKTFLKRLFFWGGGGLLRGWEHHVSILKYIRNEVVRTSIISGSN